MRKDIENRDDIIALVDRFYERVKQDYLIARLFGHLSAENWAQHLPVMYNFWENILFYKGGYGGNPMAVHDRLHRQYTLSKKDFDRWMLLFNETVDSLFEGEKAELAKQRALSIATLMQSKILPGRDADPVY